MDPTSWLILAAEPPGWVGAATPILVLLLGGGGIYTLLKIRPESAMVTVQSAEQVVVMTTRELERKDKDNAKLTAELAEVRQVAAAAERAAKDCTESLESLGKHVDALRADLAKVSAERDALRLENAALEAHVVRLEARVKELERHQQTGDKA